MRRRYTPFSDLPVDYFARALAPEFLNDSTPYQLPDESDMDMLVRLYERGSVTAHSIGAVLTKASAGVGK